ncbi:MAG: EpsI family protein, partial [Burkholderiales bacterium]|nr:EpsI family protein [Burkholderiales bacterium]
RSVRRRAIFVGVSILVPIVANWARAYLIVMLGHLSNNTIAVGVDHLIYGWLFFGVVLMLLFWVGTFWREEPQAPLPAPAAAAGSPAHDIIWALPALAAFGLIVAVWPLATRALVGKGDAGAPVLAAVAAPPAWTVTPGGLTQWSPRFVGASATSHDTYARGPVRVGLYVAYYRNQGEGHKLVSTENVLASSDNDAWKALDATLVEPGLAQAPAEVRETIVKRADGSPIVTWRWYWIDGHTTANDVAAKLSGLRMRIAGRGDDGAIVVVSAQADTVAAARETLASFVGEANPGIERALERTRGGL